MPAVTVSVAQSVQMAIPVEVKAVGTVEPRATVQVKSQVAGELLSVHFREASDVHAGDLLFEIDPKPYQEVLRQAEAAVAKDLAQIQQGEANLARDRAQLRNAESDAARYEELVRTGVVSRSQYDQFKTNADALREAARADQAAIAVARAALESDKSQIERAKLDLGYCQIHAPISGRTGSLLVHAGNLVKANGDSALVVINQIAPIYVSFGVPERYLAEIRARNAGQGLPVQVAPQDKPSAVSTGTLAVIDNAVDSSTGTIRLKALFENKNLALWPGEFLNVTMALSSVEGVAVPSEALQSGQKGQFLYVVKPDQTVELRMVTPGVSAGGKTMVLSGVSVGETVVIDGQFGLFPGAKIRIVPASKIESQGL